VTTKLATFISMIFHPLLLTSFLFLILSYFAPYITTPVSGAIASFLLIVFVITFLIPLLSISLLKISKSITNFQLEDRKERVLPFSFISIFYMIISGMFVFKLGLSPVFNQIFITITIIVMTITIITLYWKISAHSAGVAGLMGFLLAFHIKSPLGNLLWPIFFTVLVVGMVMSARLYLNVHRPGEVQVGALLGFCFSFFSTIFFG